MSRILDSYNLDKDKKAEIENALKKGKLFAINELYKAAHISPVEAREVVDKICAEKDDSKKINSSIENNEFIKKTDLTVDEINANADEGFYGLKNLNKR